MKKEPKIVIAKYYIKRLLDPVMRKRIEDIIQSLRESDLDDIRWGVYGNTLLEIKEVLEAMPRKKGV